MIDIAPQNVTVTEDPVVLSCVIHRLNKQVSITDPTLITDITAEDRQTANDLRNYYLKKYTFLSLKSDKPLSPYRVKAFQLLSSSNLTFPEDHVGIYIKLPSFYQEDCAHDALRNEYDITKLALLNASTDRITKDLRFLKISKQWRGSETYENFWFEDGEKYLYNLALNSKNPLIESFKDALTSSPRLMFNCHKLKMESLHFYSITNFKILQGV